MTTVLPKPEPELIETKVGHIRVQHDRDAPILTQDILEVSIKDSNRVYTRIDGPGEGQKIPWNRYYGGSRRVIFSHVIGRCNTSLGGWVEMYDLNGNLEYSHKSEKG